MWYLCIPVIVFLGDLLVKNHMEKARDEGEEKDLCGGRIVLTKLHNKGAAFSFLEKRQEFVSGLSGGITICIVIGYMWLLGKKGMGLLKVALSFVLGGALSNIYDRIKRNYVVDYIRFETRWKKFNRIVFNISDFFIFIGSFLFILWNGKQKS